MEAFEARCRPAPRPTETAAPDPAAAAAASPDRRSKVRGGDPDPRARRSSAGSASRCAAGQQREQRVDLRLRVRLGECLMAAVVPVRIAAAVDQLDADRARVVAERLVRDARVGDEAEHRAVAVDVVVAAVAGALVVADLLAELARECESGSSVQCTTMRSIGARGALSRRASYGSGQSWIRSVAGMREVSHGRRAPRPQRAPGCYDRGLMKGTVILSPRPRKRPDATKVSALARVADALGWQQRAARLSRHRRAQGRHARSTRASRACSRTCRPTGASCSADRAWARSSRALPRSSASASGLFLLALPLEIPGYWRRFAAARCADRDGARLERRALSRSTPRSISGARTARRCIWSTTTIASAARRLLCRDVPPVPRRRSTDVSSRAYFATCAKGLEYLLRDELVALGASDVHEKLAGVAVRGRARDRLSRLPVVAAREPHPAAARRVRRDRAPTRSTTACRRSTGAQHLAVDGTLAVDAVPHDEHAHITRNTPRSASRTRSSTSSASASARGPTSTSNARTCASTCGCVATSRPSRSILPARRCTGAAGGRAGRGAAEGEPRGRDAAARAAGRSVRGRRRAASIRCAARARC